MRIETQSLGIELKREGRAYLEYVVFAALREFLPRIGLVNVCLRASGREDAAVTCVMAADLLPSGRAVVAHRAGHPYAAIDGAAAELRRRIELELPSGAVPSTPKERARLRRLDGRRDVRDVEPAEEENHGTTPDATEKKPQADAGVAPAGS
mgnify:CR=1 FL=1